MTNEHESWYPPENPAIQPPMAYTHYNPFPLTTDFYSPPPPKGSRDNKAILILLASFIGLVVLVLIISALINGTETSDNTDRILIQEATTTTVDNDVMGSFLIDSDG